MLPFASKLTIEGPATHYIGRNLWLMGVWAMETLSLTPLAAFRPMSKILSHCAPRNMGTLLQLQVIRPTSSLYSLQCRTRLLRQTRNTLHFQVLEPVNQ